MRLSSFSQIYHPVRLTRDFYFGAFLTKLFEERYRFKGVTDLVRGKPFVQDEVYYVGRKWSPARWV